MPDPFRGAIPDDRLYDLRYDMWVVRAADGSVRIGPTSFGLHLAGEVIMFTGKPKGAEVGVGKGLGTVETGKTILAIHSPVALCKLACNEAAEESPQLVNADPYGQGWLGEGEPTDWVTDSARLVDAATYREHVRSVDPLAVFLD
jgi:glycine cleavage system H protein